MRGHYIFIAFNERFCVFLSDFAPLGISFSFVAALCPPCVLRVVRQTGGPGCSSSLALLGENGPCSVNEHGDGTVPNPHSWNENAHALWLDQPTGVGYSYGAIDDHSEEMVGENAYYFLQSFLQSHPEYAKNPLFITGESYAGHYGK